MSGYSWVNEHNFSDLSYAAPQLTHCLKAHV